MSVDPVLAQYSDYAFASSFAIYVLALVLSVVDFSSAPLSATVRPALAHAGSASNPALPGRIALLPNRTAPIVRVALPCLSSSSPGPQRHRACTSRHLDAPMASRKPLRVRAFPQRCIGGMLAGHSAAVPDSIVDHLRSVTHRGASVRRRRKHVCRGSAGRTRSSFVLDRRARHDHRRRLRHPYVRKCGQRTFHDCRGGPAVEETRVALDCGTTASSELLDRVAYRTTVVGFPLFSIGVICGAIWAEAAWGRFWGWDPKETVSFISWVLYAAYLHARATAGLKNMLAAWINVAALATMLFNMFAINYVVSGLHSYAGLN